LDQSVPRKGAAITTDAKKILDDAMQLSEADRAELAGRLIDSLDDAVDENVQEEWSEEIASRLAEFDTGTAKPIPWSEVRKRLS
jgi:putative addiction module component (TIGR02574 family)